MGMYCNQCQESVRGTCIARGVCGKNEATAKLQDALIYAIEGIALCTEASGEKPGSELGRFISEVLFVTVTNTNFDDNAIAMKVREALKVCDVLLQQLNTPPEHDSVTWQGESAEDFIAHAEKTGIEALSDNEDLRSLKSLVLYGLKGLAAYADHAAVLGYEDEAIYEFYRYGACRSDKGA